MVTTSVTAQTADLLPESNPIEEEQVFHSVEVSEVAARLSTSLQDGLSTDEAKRRLDRDGANLLTPSKDHGSFVKYLLSLVTGFGPIMWISFILMLITYEPLGAGIYNLSVALVILVVIFVQGFFSWYQEYESSNLLASFSNMITTQVQITRDGREIVVDSFDLVVGDKVSLVQGMIIPADIRVIEAHGLKADTSVLTGEFGAVGLSAETSAYPFLESKNCLFLGTNIMLDRGSGIVIATGDRCAMSKILKMTTGAQSITTLDYEINIFIQIIATIAISLAIFVYLLWRVWIHVEFPGYLNESAVISNCIAILLGVVPTGMPVALSASLTLIAKRLCDTYKVLVTRMGTIETLGCMSVLMSDKTGTITKNEMRVVDLIFGLKIIPEYSTFDCKAEFITGAALTTSSKLAADEADGTAADIEQPSDLTKVIGGNGVDQALLRFVIPDVRAIKQQFDVLHELPFNSDLKYSGRLCLEKSSGKKIAYLVGAAEAVSKQCNTYLNEDGVYALLGETESCAINASIDKCASSGRRVVALAKRIISDEEPSESDINNCFSSHEFALIGCLGLQDPPRDNAMDTIEKCRKSNVRVMMITGDHPLTALSISRQVGIITCPVVNDFRSFEETNLVALRLENFAVRQSTCALVIDSLRVAFGCKDTSKDTEVIHPDFRTIYKNEALVITGKELTQFTDSHWNWAVQFEEIVFARTTPDQKLSIVTEFQKRGHTVAMTGDGVNDAAALRRADCGISMQSGADIAREAADVVLLSNDFGAIYQGVEEGRLIFANLKRVINYLLPAGSWAENIPAVVNILLGIPLPLSTFQVIVICIGTDIFGATSLIYTPAEADVCESKPRDTSKDRLVDRKIFFFAYLFVGNYYALAAFVNWFYYFGQQGVHIKDLILAWDWGKEGYAGLTVDQQEEYLAHAQSIFFMTLVVLQLANLICLQTRKTPYFAKVNGERLWPTIPRHILQAMFMELSVCMILLYVPVFQQTFGTAPIGQQYWGVAIGFALFFIVISEVRKWIGYMYPGGYVDQFGW